MYVRLNLRDTGKVMRITPDDLSPDPLDLSETITPGEIDYSLDLRQTTALRVTGRAERIDEHRGPKDIVADIRLRATIAGGFEVLCARCVEAIPLHVEETFDLIFRPSGVDAEQGERSISEAETEIGYYEQGGLVLEDVVREQVLFSLPDRSLCRPDCQGLCPRCGANRNEVSCDCSTLDVDPRWKALEGLAVPVPSRSSHDPQHDSLTARK